MNGVAQSGLKPEERARAKIDQLLRNVGWQVVARGDYSSALSAAAIEEGILRGGLEADYLLFLDGRAIGVLEAKREGTDLEAVAAAQAENYTHKVPDWVKVWFPGRPLPLVYLSDGNRLLFRGDDGSYVPLAEMHSPLQVATRLDLDSFTAGYPFLSPRGLRTCQIEALAKLEASLRAGHPRALLVLATGAARYYELWKGQLQRNALSPDADALLRQLLPLIASSGTYTAEVLASENEMATLARGRRAFGSVPAFDAALKSLSRFLFGNGA